MLVFPVFVWLGKPVHFSEVGTLEPSALVLIEPAQWVGQQFPLLPHIRSEVHLGDGDWTIVLFRDGCSECEHALAALEQRQREDRFLRVAMIEVPSFWGRHMNSNRGRTGMAYGRLDDSVRWVITTPVVTVVSQGTVLRSASGKNAGMELAEESLVNSSPLGRAD